MTDRPKVRYPPPLIYGAVWLAAAGVDQFVTWSVFPLWLRIVGAGVFGGPAVALAGWALVTFRRARTAIEPWKAASALVQHGPYRLTRNPMYVSLTLLTAAVAFGADLAWLLVLGPVAPLATDRLVIRPEERHLSARFGADYDAYRRAVPRWIGRRAP
jgi:protein-S-isoprenylcysteine O-methyltransferase Ste14